MPAAVSTVRLYLTDLEAARDESGAVIYQPATLARRLAAIAAAHQDAGHPSPTRDPAVTAVLTGIRRARAAPRHRMRPLLLGDIHTLLAQMEWSTWPGGLLAARDGFVALAGFAGALRRSELAALTAGDLTWHPADGLHLRIRTSKTDQDSVGITIVLPYGRHAGTCPPCAGLRWLQLLHAATHGRQALMRAVLATPPWPEQTHLYPHPGSEDTGDGSPAAGEGNADCRAPVPDLPAGMPLLRAVRKGGHLLESPVTGDALHAMVQRRAAAADLTGQVGFHSLRAGFVTTARRNGADHRAVRRQTRHSSDAMVELYDRDHTPLAGNAVTRLGL
jgi:integrase